MQPRTLDQILQELSTTGGYNAQIENLKQQQALVPQNIQSNIEAANAAQTKAYEDIVTGARRRGVGFSGIPLGEQAKYSSTVYAPAILAAKEQGRTQALGLEQAMNQLISDRYGKAESIRQYEQNLAEQQRQANMQYSAAAAAAAAQQRYNQILADSLNRANQTNNTVQGRVEWSKDKGYQFFDYQGNPINAVKYHQAVDTGMNFRDFLTQLNKAHADTNITNALQHVGNDYLVGAAPESLRNSLGQLGITGSFRQNKAPLLSSRIPAGGPLPLTLGRSYLQWTGQ